MRYVLSHRALADDARDAVPDPHALAIRMRVNGALVQNSNTSNLIFRIPMLIAFISAAITLDPGDIIATGTPDGVGGRNPPVFLKPRCYGSRY